MAKIMIVDDEKGIRRTLSEFLRLDGHEVVEAEDADIAMRLLQDHQLDVVVTDIILPRVTGVELLRRIHEQAPQIQVIMMTGEPTVETASEALRIGATDYLFKPITKSAILRVVGNAARLKALRDDKEKLEAENRAYQEELENLVEDRTRQLQSSEARARELSRFNQAALDALTSHICVLAEDGTILAVNRAWQEFANQNPPLSEKTGVGSNYYIACQNVINPRTPDAAAVVNGLRAVAGGEVPEFTYEYDCHSPETKRWFVLRATRFAGPGPVRVVVAHENNTARKLAEAELEQNHELYRRAITAANAIPYQKHYATDTYVFLGEGIKELTGYGRGELRSAIWKEMILKTVFLGDAASLTIPEAARRSMRGELKNWRADHQIRTRTGEVRWISDSSVPIHGASGEYIGSLGILQDITERKQIETRLDCFARLGHLVNNASSSAQAAGVMTEAAAELMGWDACYLILGTLESGVVEPLVDFDTINNQRVAVPLTEVATRPTPMYRRVLTEGAKLILRQKDEPDDSGLIPSGDLNRRSQSLMFVPLRVEDTAIGLLSVQSYEPQAYTAADLETLQTLADYGAGALVRLHAAAALRESEERFRGVYENALLGLYRITPEGQILLANPALVRMLGFDSFEALVRNNLENKHLNAEAPRRNFKEAVEREGSVHGVESTWTRADGSTVMVRESARIVRDDKGKIIYYDGVVEDIT